jgi:hypothetical protein
LRKFLIIFSYINIILYFILYSLFDYMLGKIPLSGMPGPAITTIKILFLIAAGFCLGIVISILRGHEGMKNCFDYRIFLKTGILPFILLILSGGQITSLIITYFFGGSKQLSELAFYLFSRDIIWAVWLGISLGVSVKLRFKRQRQLRITDTWEVRQ